MCVCVLRLHFNNLFNTMRPSCVISLSRRNLVTEICIMQCLRTYPVYTIIHKHRKWEKSPVIYVCRIVTSLTSLSLTMIVNHLDITFEQTGHEYGFSIRNNNNNSGGGRSSAYVTRTRDSPTTARVIL